MLYRVKIMIAFADFLYNAAAYLRHHGFREKVALVMCYK